MPDASHPDASHPDDASPGAENSPRGESFSGRSEPGPPPPASNQQAGEDLSAHPEQTDDAPDTETRPAPGQPDRVGESRDASARPAGTAVVGRPSAPDGEVGST